MAIILENRIRGKAVLSPISSDKRHIDTGRICGIVVTYYPDFFVLERLLRVIISQIAGVVIVENTPDSAISGWLSKLELSGAVALIDCGKNIGVAAAYNRGIEWARSCGCDYVLLMDQDSIPASDMVEKQIEAVSQLTSKNIKFSAVGPRYVDSITHHDSFFVRFGPGLLRRIRCRQSKDPLVPVDFLISSGSLIPLEALSVVGPMDESLFVDHVDTEWLMRAAANGYQAFGVCDAFMEHRLGDASPGTWFRCWPSLPKHSPLRHYYVIRNSILLYRRDYVPFRWIVADVFRSTRIFFYYSLCSPPRLAQFSMMLRGLWDGILGRTGILPD